MTQPAHILTTERLVLRRPEAGDLPAYRAFYRHSDVAKGRYRRRESDAEVAAILDDDIEHWRKRGFGMWLMRLTGENDVIGGAGLSHADGWPSHELTWWLMPGHRGKGFATEASRAIIAWAHRTLGWPRVETYMRDENLPARRLAERLGGRVCRRETFPDGVTRDVFALSEEPVA